MGAIQGAINGALGTVAATAVAGEHMKEKSELKAEQGLLAKEQYHEADAAIKELQGQLSDKKNE